MIAPPIAFTLGTALALAARAVDAARSRLEAGGLGAAMLWLSITRGGRR